MNTLRIAIGQINTIVGDLEGNSKKVVEFVKKAEKYHVDIISFPELTITGYPPEDLLLKKKFVEDNVNYLKELSKTISNVIVIVGFVAKKGKNIFNAAGILYEKRIINIYHKMLLPNYGVFDEKRYFTPGTTHSIFKFGNVSWSVNICEDLWHEKGPTKLQAKYGAQIIFNISASPYHAGKIREREEIIKKQAQKNKVIIAYNNLIGGQDEIVFDGQSMVVDSKGKIISRAAAFKEDLHIIDIPINKMLSATSTKEGIRGNTKIYILNSSICNKSKPPISKRSTRTLYPIEEIYQALILGLRDYVLKNEFQKVVIGLSGGIDSSIVATIAVDSLGNKNVIGVFMPSQFTLKESKEDAIELAKNLQIKFLNIPIKTIFESYLSILKPHFGKKRWDVTEENLQARIRGNILMALSNKFGWLVLTTSNKSEVSTGYGTLYGDMAGGFALIKDVPKTLVYKLTKYRNSLKFVIPERVLLKEPTAELKKNQKDSDTLPTYEKLDQILKAYIEEDKDSTEIISSGLDEESVKRVVKMVERSEYKRRQSPPGVKITPKAFGKDRRIPITNKFQG